MINDKQLKQTNAAGSTGYQSGGAMTVHGVSYTEARQIALDLWKANALELSQIAAQVALDRANKLLDAFLEKLSQRNTKLLDSLNDPGMQWALFSAQKDYARNGNDDVFELLVEILSERAEQTDRNILQIVLDESISVVPKLTEEHLNIITLVFILRTATIEVGPSLSEWNIFLHTCIEPFCKNVKPTSSCINHLQYSNCISIEGEGLRQNLSDTQFASLLQKKYPIFFLNGFDTYDFMDNCGHMSDYPSELFCSYFYDDKMIQFNYINTEYFFTNVNKIKENEASKINSADSRVQTLLHYMNANMKNPDEAKQYLESNWHFLHDINAFSANYRFSALRLTSVGIALAQANFKRQTGISLPLSNWIN